MTERTSQAGLECTVSENIDIIDISKPRKPGRAESAIYRATLFGVGVVLGGAMALAGKEAGYDHTQNLVLTAFTSLFMFPLLDNAFLNLSGREISERAVYIAPGVATGLYLVQTLKQL